MGFTEILTIIFIVLKLLGVITWSWWLVCLPEIIAVALYIIVFLLGLFGVPRISKVVNKHFDNFEL